MLEGKRGRRALSATALNTSARDASLAGRGRAAEPLLQLSGLGGAGCCSARNSVVHGAGVGESAGPLQARVVPGQTADYHHDELKSVRGRVGMGWRWLAHRAGPLAIGINYGGMFARAAASASPDIQFHFAALSAEMAGAATHPWPGCTFPCASCGRRRRGTVMIKSRDPLAAPALRPNYLSTELGAAPWSGASKSRNLAHALERLIGDEYRPGDSAQATTSARSCAITARRFSSSRHLQDGRRPRSRGRRAVASSSAGARVVDASIIPTLVSNITRQSC